MDKIISNITENKNFKELIKNVKSNINWYLPTNKGVIEIYRIVVREEGDSIYLKFQDRKQFVNPMIQGFSFNLTINTENVGHFLTALQLLKDTIVIAMNQYAELIEFTSSSSGKYNICLLLGEVEKGIQEINKFKSGL